MNVSLQDGIMDTIGESGMIPGGYSRGDHFLPYLLNFQKVSAGDILPVRFKRRLTSKFVMSEEVFLSLLPLLEESFHLITHSEEIFRTLNFRYFDTKDFRYYLDHINGKYSRIKIRLRKGGAGGPDELEIWSRQNKGSMVKNRIPVFDPSAGFISNLIPAHCIAEVTVPELRPSLDIIYDRFSFLRNDSGERIIIDTGVSFFKPDSSIAELSLKNLIFAEVRRKRKQKSIFESALRNKNIRKTGLSKYCLGIAKTEPWLKSNTCKPVLRIIEKLLNQVYV